MEIKTCPFCGAVPKILEQSVGTPYEAYFVRCSNPKCEAEIRQPYSAKEEAVDAWNTRVDSETREIDQNGNEENENEASVKKNLTVSMELVKSFHHRMEAKFGNRAVWATLFLLTQIDMKTWTFPEEIRNDRFDKIMDEIEQDEDLKKAFQEQRKINGGEM